MKPHLRTGLVLIAVTLLASCTSELGQFEGHTDIGDIAIPGTISYSEPDYTNRSTRAG